MKEKIGKKDKLDGSKNFLLKYFGALKNADIDWNEKEKRMRELRDSFNRRLGEARNRHSND